MVVGGCCSVAGVFSVVSWGVSVVSKVFWVGFFCVYMVFCVGMVYWVAVSGCFALKGCSGLFLLLGILGGCVQFRGCFGWFLCVFGWFLLFIGYSGWV